MTHGSSRRAPFTATTDRYHRQVMASWRGCIRGMFFVTVPIVASRSPILLPAIGIPLYDPAAHTSRRWTRLNQVIPSVVIVPSYTVGTCRGQRVEEGDLRR